ncbi:MAG: hypothetical protein MHM6MM_006059 [Cercozoa sp. M6MM]
MQLPAPIAMPAPYKDGMSVMSFGTGVTGLTNATAETTDVARSMATGATPPCFVETHRVPALELNLHHRHGHTHEYPMELLSPCNVYHCQQRKQPDRMFCEVHDHIQVFQLSLHKIFVA